MNKEIEKNGLFINLVLRGCLGMVIVYFVNMFLEKNGINAAVGLNVVAAVTTATLGLPGVGLLYGVTFFNML